MDYHSIYSISVIKVFLTSLIQLALVSQIIKMYKELKMVKKYGEFNYLKIIKF